MTWEEYIKASARTDNETCSIRAWDNYTLGLFGEVGEVTELVKKHLYHGHELDRERMREELGDVCWYLAALYRWTNADFYPDYDNDPIALVDIVRGLAWAAGRPMRMRDGASHAGTPINLGHVLYYLRAMFSRLGLTEGEVLQANIAKLAARYPDGFSEAASQGRSA